MRRLAIVLVLILAVLAIAWTAGWFLLAAWADEKSADMLAGLEERGIRVRCEGRDIVGFPFTLRMACGETEIVEARSGSTAILAGMRGGVSVFAPRTARIEFDAPADVQSPLVPGPAEFSWREAAVQVGIGVNGPWQVGFDAVDFAASIPAGAVEAERADGVLAPSEDGGSIAKFSFNRLELTVDGTAYPSLDGSVAALLSVPPRALLSGRAALQAPLSAREIKVMLENGEAKLQAEGDIAVDTEGILDGAITLRLAGAEGLGAFIAALPADAQKMGNAIAGAMLAFGRPTSLDGESAIELVVEITRGRAKVGMFEADLPRLKL
jgi:hypothetical protein